MSIFIVFIIILCLVVSGFLFGYIFASEKKEKEMLEKFQYVILSARLTEDEKVSLLQHFMEEGDND